MQSKRAVALVVVLAAVGAILLAGCGSSEEHADHAGSKPVQSRVATDRALLNEMTPHHESAIEMATAARRLAQHAEVRKLAASIIRDQQADIAQMTRLKAELPSGGSDSRLGMSMHQMGMSMDMDALERAKPFDRAFIDAMVPHHEGAIAMAKVELAKGKNAKVRALAKRIISAQRREIAEMRAWRKRWYSAPVPKPGAGRSGGDHAGMQ